MECSKLWQKFDTEYAVNIEQPVAKKKMKIAMVLKYLYTTKVIKSQRPAFIWY